MSDESMFNETMKGEIATMVAGILHKKYGAELKAATVREIVDGSLEELRKRIADTKAQMQEDALERLRSRFRKEIEPMLWHFTDRVGPLLSKWDGDKVFESLLHTELVSLLREKARHWARKAATASVHFSFDEIFGE